MIKNKIISYLSYGSLIIGAGIGIYALIDIYLVRRKLPAGTCPVIDNKPIIYLALAFCAVAFILSFFEPKTKK